MTPAEVRPTVPGSDVLDAPSGPRDPALRLTDAGVDVSQNYLENRPTTPGEPLQRARQAARAADPEFGRPTEPFSPGTQQARLNEVRPTTIDRTPFSERPTTVGESVQARSGTPTTIDRTPFAERATVQGESVLARQGTPTTVDRTPFAERATVQGESVLGRQGTPTAADPLSPAERAFESSPRTSSYATTADDAASLLGRAKGAARAVGEVASAGFRSPVARGVASLPAAAITAAMELEKYLDPRGKTFTDDIEMMYEGVNETRSGKPSPVSYTDIKSRDDLASNYRGLLGAVTGNMGTTTGGDVTMSRLTSIGGAPEVFQLMERGLLDKNFLREAASDMSQEQRAMLFTNSLNASPEVFTSVYEALGGDAATSDIETYKRYAVDSGLTTAEKNIKRLTDAGVLPGKSSASSKAPAAKTPKAPATDAPKSKKSSFPTLAMGARGGEVTNIQQRLVAMGYDIGPEGVDGKFGNNTKAAVEAFQRDRGLTVDGIVGRNTYAAFTDAAEEARSAAKADTAPEAVTPQFGAGLKRVDEGAFNAAANEFEDMAVIEPVGSDRDAPTQNTQAYLDLGLDEEVRPSAFPMFRRRRNRK